jgi:hypothetical protein
VPTRLTEQPLTPLLSLKGAVHESNFSDELRAEGATLVDLSEHGVDDSVRL